MSDIGEGLAEATQGALAANAVEPAAVADDGHTRETACLNCGTALVGPHCHACGQAAHVHRTLGAFWHDLLHGVFHFEGKVWRTLPLLVWRPGKLTREYIDGRRASYISPIALFLFTVFLMFAVFHAIEGSEPAGESAPNGIVVETDGGGTFSSNVPQLDKAVRKLRANPELAAYKLQTYAYKYSWALIPISVPFLWLLFPFSRRFHLYDHTVFVTYSLCFMTLLVTVGMLGGAIGAGWIGGLLFLVPPFHMHRQLRETYALGRGGALWRTALLVLFASAALLIFFLLIMAQTGA